MTDTWIVVQAAALEPFRQFVGVLDGDGEADDHPVCSWMFGDRAHLTLTAKQFRVLVQSSCWLPIESALTEDGGNRIMSFNGVHNLAQWREAAADIPRGWHGPWGYLVPQPTHWMPLPTAPLVGESRP